MIEIKKDEMKAGVVYIGGDIFLNTPKVEVAVLNKDGDKISVHISDRATDPVIVFINDIPKMSFDGHSNFKGFLKKNFENESLHEAFFCWMFRFMYAANMYKTMTYEEKKRVIFNDTRKGWEKKFNLPFNDNVQQINDVYDFFKYSH